MLFPIMPGVAAPKEEKTNQKKNLEKSLEMNFRKHGSLSVKVFEMITTVPTIGCLVGLRLGEAQPFHFGAGRLPETRRTEKKKPSSALSKQEAVRGDAVPPTPAQAVKLLLRAAGMLLTPRARRRFSS